MKHLINFLLLLMILESLKRNMPTITMTKPLPKNAPTHADLEPIASLLNQLKGKKDQAHINKINETFPR